MILDMVQIGEILGLHRDVKRGAQDRSRNVAANIFRYLTTKGLTAPDIFLLAY